MNILFMPIIISYCLYTAFWSGIFCEQISKYHLFRRTAGVSPRRRGGDQQHNIKNGRSTYHPLPSPPQTHAHPSSQPPPPARPTVSVFVVIASHAACI